MNTGKLAVKVSRPMQCLFAAAGAWIIALLSNGSEWLNQPKVAVTFCAAFSCLGSSLLHYGVRHEMYARKWWDRVVIPKPSLLVILGIAAFVVSITIATVFLSSPCTMVAVGNFVMITLYGVILDRVWPVKNIVASLVCVTPIVLGWFAGNRLNPIVPSLILGTLCVYLAREGIKDTEDVEANRGLRFTLPMMVGRLATMRVAGLCMLASIFFYLRAARDIPGHPMMPLILMTSAIGVFAALAFKLIAKPRLQVRYQTVDIGVALLMMTILGVRAGLP